MTLGEVGNEMVRIIEEDDCDDIIVKGLKLHAAAFQDFVNGTRVAQNPFIIAIMRALLAGLEADTDETGMEIEKCIEESIAVVSLTVERSNGA